MRSSSPEPDWFRSWQDHSSRSPTSRATPMSLECALRLKLYLTMARRFQCLNGRLKSRDAAVPSFNVSILV